MFLVLHIAISYLLLTVMSQDAHNRKCAIHKCHLPKCRCSHAESPDLLSRDQLPQMVIFTFDDAVTKRDENYYQHLFAPDRRNPNGCPISMTMFVQHQYTDYKIVKKLYERGMEAAVHSVTHRVPTDFWKNPSEQDLKNEILDQRENLHKKAGIPYKHIQGWRSPFLQPSGELQYKILKENNFMYDSTLTTGRRSFYDNIWPFTLDYGWPLNCEVKPCPKERYSGLWEFPIAPLIARQGGQLLSFTYVDSYRPENGTEAFEYLKENFLAYYKGNKEIFMINMHTSWFYFKHNYYGMDLFIRYLLTLDDVFIVNVQQALAWMKAPLPLKYTTTFRPWSCEKPVARTKPQHKPTIYMPTTAIPTTSDPLIKHTPCVPNDNCLKPDCRCDKPFVSLAKKERPQIVLFTFDDAVNVQNGKWYDRLFANDRRNPNGCPISMTLFIQDKYTNYNVVKKLYSRGMEVAVHSVTHRYPNAWWKDASEVELYNEVQGMRRKIEMYAGIPQHHVVGWRSPFLQPTGDTLFKILKDNRFQYDSTLTVDRQRMDSEQVWPFTLDYGWKRDCVIDKCPVDFYKGIWEFPIFSLIDPVSNLACTYVDSCRPKNKSIAFNYLLENFKSYYNGDRAPFMLNMHASWFIYDENLPAMDQFIQHILKNDDVYIITVNQALQWMRNPAPLSTAKSFHPWSCYWRPPSPFPYTTNKPSKTSKQPMVSGKGTESRSTEKVRNTVKGNTVTRTDSSTTSAVKYPAGESGSIEWYVTVLIVLVILALVIISTLIIISVVKKRQAMQVKHLVKLAAKMNGNKEENYGNENPAMDRALTLEMLKTISSSRINVSDNVYQNTMELRRMNATPSVMSQNGPGKTAPTHPQSNDSHAVEITKDNQPSNKQHGHRSIYKNLPLPHPPVHGSSLSTMQKQSHHASSKVLSTKAASKDNSKSRGITANRYEGDLEAVRNSVMDDLNEFSRNHNRMSLTSTDNHYYSLDDPWLNLNLQGDANK